MDTESGNGTLFIAYVSEYEGNPLGAEPLACLHFQILLGFLTDAVDAERAYQVVDVVGRRIVHEELQDIEVLLPAIRIFANLLVRHIVHLVPQQRLEQDHLPCSEHAAPPMIGLQVDRARLAWDVTNGPLNLITVAEPGDAAPINSKDLVELLKLLSSHVLTVLVYFIQQDSLDFLLARRLKELPVLETHESLGVVVDLGSLHGVVQVVLEFVVGGVA